MSCNAVAELRDAEKMLKGLAASQTIAAENWTSSNGENPPLAYCFGSTTEQIIVRPDRVIGDPWRGDE